MIEQTELIVTKWQYHPPINSIEEDPEKLLSSISFDVMKKRATTKKGIACRFTVRFEFENKTILEYAGEDSYVIDLQDIIDKSELQRMIRNSYSKFNDKFEFKKFGTVLRNKSLLPFDETKYDLDPVLALLQ
ncbi:MAG TPA: hypothetical protein VHQ93_18825 [Chitinophagaceae bacterium]|jgi:hypothetical protein|nr:hypothetical protein [Chitinophagaceae bacterium]